MLEKAIKSGVSFVKCLFNLKLTFGNYCSDRSAKEYSSNGDFGATKIDSSRVCDRHWQ